MNTPTQSALPEPGHPGRTHRVLVVDDDDVIRGLHEEILSMYGFGTESAADGREALKILEHEKFDLVLTDFEMPRVNGCELTRVARAHGHDMPIVMISGSLTREELPEDVAGELDALLAKPARTHEIITAIQQALHHPVAAVN
jgi:CheY-like chemotaxis protein